MSAKYIKALEDHVEALEKKCALLDRLHEYEADKKYWIYTISITKDQQQNMDQPIALMFSDKKSFKEAWKYWLFERTTWVENATQLLACGEKITKDGLTRRIGWIQQYEKVNGKWEKIRISVGSWSGSKNEPRILQPLRNDNE